MLMSYPNSGPAPTERRQGSQAMLVPGCQRWSKAAGRVPSVAGNARDSFVVAVESAPACSRRFPATGQVFGTVSVAEEDRNRRDALEADLVGHGSSKAP